MLADDLDHSDDFARLRAQIDAETNGGYRAFRASLTPRYRQVWRDLAGGYLALGAILVLVELPTTAAASVVAAIAGAIGVGYVIAYLQLFLHEAAHHNIAPTRALNDRLAALLICWQVGTDIQQYRRVHFEHHRKLGLPEDTEHSYFHALTPGFLLEMLTGVHALRVLLSRARTTRRDPQAGASIGSAVLSGMAVHAALIAVLAIVGAWADAVAWIVGIAVVFPVFATVRQLLEHRSASADPVVDYGAEPHGALTRMFGAGPLASTFGGAGFNRHLLHHWEPQVSYTRLADLERYLLGTGLGPIIEARRTSYGRALAAILRNDTLRHDPAARHA